MARKWRPRRDWWNEGHFPNDREGEPELIVDTEPGDTYAEARRYLSDCAMGRARMNRAKALVALAAIWGANIEL